jgi:hypothetical protein
LKPGGQKVKKIYFTMFLILLLILNHNPYVADVRGRVGKRKKNFLT